MWGLKVARPCCNTVLLLRKLDTHKVRGSLIVGRFFLEVAQRNRGVATVMEAGLFHSREDAGRKFSRRDPPRSLSLHEKRQ